MVHDKNSTSAKDINDELFHQKIDHDNLGILVHQKFKPFEQVRRASSLAHERTDLHLFLTKSLVEMHQSQLTIESELGLGTTIYVKSP